jgi:hypothetical protein
MNRNELKALRPQLFIENTESTSSIERFQNDSLRPIIKFQHEVIISLVTSHVLFNATLNSKGHRIGFQKKVREFINGQTALKNQLIGLISGVMTSSEFDFYLKKHQEINKRITQMICQRVSDTLY